MCRSNMPAIASLWAAQALPLHVPLSITESQVKTTTTEAAVKMDAAAAHSLPTTLLTVSTCRHRLRRQSPGTTANNNKRHFVSHDYHDYSMAAAGATLTNGAEGQGRASSTATSELKQGGMFPLKLHDILSETEQKGLGHIISWAPHGRCFMVHKPKAFVGRILPKYFHQSKLSSFQRQLNLYGFHRLHHGPDRGSYYHECFLRGQPALATRMVRVKIKGTRIKPASNPDDEPNFYAMPSAWSADESKVSCPTLALPAKTVTSANVLSNATISTTSMMQLKCDSHPLQPTSADMVAIPSASAETCAAAPLGAHVSPCGSDIATPMLQVPSDGRPLSYLAAQAEKHTYKCNQFQQLLDSCNDPILNDVVDDVFFDDSVDSDMIGDFCADWTPSLQDVASKMTLDENWLLSFK